MNEEYDQSIRLPKQNLVSLQETLYSSKSPTRRWLHCSRRDWIIEALHRYTALLDNRQNALEVGPGSGLYLPVLASLFENVIALDIEEAYLEHIKSFASKYANLSFLVDDITTSQLDSNSFDLILCSEVIEHIEHSALVLSEIHRLLKPGGFLVLSTPQCYSPLELTAKIAFLPGIITLVRWIYREPILDSGHINLMSEKMVIKQLQSAGFTTILERYKSGFYLPVIAELTGRIGLRIEQWFEKILRDSWSSGLLQVQYYITQKNIAYAASQGEQSEGELPSNDHR